METSRCWSQGIPPKDSYRHGVEAAQDRGSRAVDGRAGGVQLPKPTGAQAIPSQPSGAWHRTLVFALLSLVLRGPAHSILCPHGMRMFALCLSTFGNTLVITGSHFEEFASEGLCNSVGTGNHCGDFLSWVECDSY